MLKLPPSYIPYGIEVSEQLAADGAPEFEARGGEMINADALSGLRAQSDAFFSAMMMRSFLEHDIRPLEVLKEAGRVLRPGGIVVIKVPNFGSLNRRLRGRKWCGFRFPDHVNYFTPATLKAMVEKAGLAVARFNLEDRLPSSDNMWLIARAA